MGSLSTSLCLLLLSLQPVIPIWVLTFARPCPLLSIRLHGFQLLGPLLPGCLHSIGLLLLLLSLWLSPVPCSVSCLGKALSTVNPACLVPVLRSYTCRL